MDEKEIKLWTKFKSVKSNSINKEEQKLIAGLHSKYFNHSYWLPCGCNPKDWNRWISDLNTLYDEHRKDT
tara:strand:+ start:41 stop:250 length:210 start_codon:yes stop_codon:yes gene_type:complete